MFCRGFPYQEELHATSLAGRTILKRSARQCRQQQKRQAELEAAAAHARLSLDIGQLSNAELVGRMRRPHGAGNMASTPRACRVARKVRLAAAEEEVSVVRTGGLFARSSFPSVSLFHLPTLCLAPLVLDRWCSSAATGCC